MGLRLGPVQQRLGPVRQNHRLQQQNQFQEVLTWKARSYLTWGCWLWHGWLFCIICSQALSKICNNDIRSRAVASLCSSKKHIWGWAVKLLSWRPAAGQKSLQFKNSSLQYRETYCLQDLMQFDSSPCYIAVLSLGFVLQLRTSIIRQCTALFLWCLHGSRWLRQS